VTTVSLFRHHRAIWLTLAAFVASAVLVNPLRETALEDDWVYSLTVKHLLETGEYRLHDWSAANMPFQAYWGGLFATVAGYSFGTLRVSTLVLAFIGLIAFYHLARHHDLEPDAAGIATLALLATPLAFRFSYTFDTDVPFLACWIIALSAYTAGLARGRPALILLGGAAGAAAILTRQFGVALIPALAGCWLLDPKRKTRWPLYALGVLPLLGPAAWQLWAGLAGANWGAMVSRAAQARHLADPVHMILEMVWRPAIILHYVALSSLALLPIAVVRIARGRRKRDSRTQDAGSDRRAVLLIAAYVAAAAVLGALALDRPWLMPYIPWALHHVSNSWPASLALTALTGIGAVIVGQALYRRYTARERRAAPEHWLLDLATLFLAAQYLILFKIGDRYLLGLAPLALIALGWSVRHELSSRFSLAVLSGLAVLAASSVWTRGILTYQEARWSAADAGRNSGIATRRIFGPWTWMMYHRSADYLADFQGRIPVHLSNSIFEDWLPVQERRAEYHVIVSRTPPPPPWEVFTDIPFRDITFRPSHAFLVRRRPGPVAR
jgi:hypothetical protein